MNQYQVTVKFPKSNVYEVVGRDAVERAEAERLYRVYENLGHCVHMHELTLTGSRLVKQTDSGLQPA